MVAIPEIFLRRSHAVAIEYQLAMPAKVLENNPSRLWASVVCGQFDVPVALSANPLAQIGDPDTCVFPPAQGAVYFQTYGTNELYLIGLPVGTPVNIATVVKEPRLNVPANRRSVRPATRIVTDCGNVDIVMSGGSGLFLAEDPARRRLTARIDSVFGALTTADAAPSFDFMTVAPFFPGYAVIEGTEELRWLDFGTGPTNAGFIRDREVSAV